MSSSRFLYRDGVLLRSADAPPVTTFLESQPGAYTTTRTENNATRLLFWERHLKRLADSARILLNSRPELLFKSHDSNYLSSLTIRTSILQSGIWSLVNDSMNKALRLVPKESSRNDGQELAITALISGDTEKLNGTGKNFDEESVLNSLDVSLHIGACVPVLFGVRKNAAHLALVGCGRDVAAAKYSDWVIRRKPLEKLRPPMITELLLSNDGDHILEGCITNFFVVCRKDHDESAENFSGDLDSRHRFEVQTAPISDGVLPGVIRELVIEVCLSNGIPIQEKPPSWSEHALWEEAFITKASLFFGQFDLATNMLYVSTPKHVEMIKAPKCSWESLDSKNPDEIQWEEKRFQDGPGMITKLIQKEIMERASVEGYPLSKFT